jgi:hypothetical protein
VELLLYLIGAAATLLLILNNIARTALRQKEIRLLEIGLAFFAVLMPVAALLLDNLQDALFGTLENLMLLLIIPLTILSVGLTIVELFRPQRLRQSRGLLGFGVAALLAIATFGYNIIALNAQNSALQGNPVPTPVNVSVGGDPCEAAFQNLFIDLANQIADVTGLTIEEFFTVIEEQPDLSIASLIEANGGNPAAFISTLTTDMQDAIRDLLARGCIEAGQATTILGGLPFFLPSVIYDDFSQFQEFFPQDASISPTDVQSTRVALIATLNQAPSPLPSLTPTFTPSRTPSPTATRTPRPVDTATATLSRFITNTPTLTPTLPNPCLATADFNVNLRSYPSLEESEILILIPFESTITIYAPNEDKTWWYGLYEGEVGWISSEYIRLSSSCDNLPPRRP